MPSLSPILPSSCVSPLTTVVLDALDIVQSLLAFHLPRNKELTLSYEAWVQANPQTGKSLLPDVSAFHKAADASDRAHAFVQLVKKVFNSDGFSALWQAIRSASWTWWDWV